KQKEFREKIMDSPAFQFSGVTEPIINQKVGVNHINGIYIRPEYPVYSTAAEQVTFILNNYSGGTIECGERYYVTFEDEKGIWWELPMNTAFVSIAYVIQDKREREMRASLYPDVHPNKAGRYRYFYEVTINRKPVLMMAEFRLSDNEKEWKEAKRTPLPEGLLTMKQDNTHQTVGEQVEELVYDMVEVMPEFPGGVRAMLDFIKKNIQYPEIARKNGIQGRVIVGVVVDKNGSVTNLTILKSIDPYLDKEAIRVIRLMPKWKPGTQMDKPVKVKYAIPVSFKLAD
ncbi:energy transducer TonB, partial [Bacteroides ovatus]